MLQSDEEYLQAFVRMHRQPKYLLYIYDGDFSLPSFDVECIKSILYTTMAYFPVEVRQLTGLKGYTFRSAPRLVCKNLAFTSFNEMLAHFKALNFDLDGRLGGIGYSDNFALCSLVQFRLKPVVDFTYWLDERNFDEFTRMWFMKALPFPFNYLHVSRLKRNAREVIGATAPAQCNLDELKDFLNRSLNQCLTVLSSTLGNRDYFFGSDPTTLDILVYAYLAPLVKLPFPSNDAVGIIYMYPNITELIKRIDDTYLPHLPKQSKYMKQKSTTGDDDVSYVAILILSAGAAALALGFAVNRGIISFK